MQRISRTRATPLRGAPSISRTRRSKSCSTIRDSRATGLSTLGQPFGQALPQLLNLPLEYSHEARAELLYDLCAALVREEMGTPESWAKSEQRPLVFAQEAIMRAIGEERWNLLQRNVEFHLSVTDTIESDSPEVFLDRGRLALVIECSGSGYLKVGPAIEALEAEAAGLGAAFYWALIHSIYRVMRIYDHTDALQYEEGMHEMVESDGEESQYEFPHVKDAIPECVQKSMEAEHAEQRGTSRRLLASARGGKYSHWIARLRRMERLARVKVKHDRGWRDEHWYDNIPLPSLMIAFRDHDAVTACFDEEGQYMLEGSSEPTLLVRFDPRDPTEVGECLRAVARFVLFNQELFELVEELNACPPQSP
jgi:hypothetical protein